MFLASPHGNCQERLFLPAVVTEKINHHQKNIEQWQNQILQLIRNFMLLEKPYRHQASKGIKNQTEYKIPHKDKI